jgi:hypothetical protein
MANSDKLKMERKEAVFSTRFLVMMLTVFICSALAFYNALVYCNDMERGASIFNTKPGNDSLSWRSQIANTPSFAAATKNKGNPYDGAECEVLPDNEIEGECNVSLPKPGEKVMNSNVPAQSEAIAQEVEKRPRHPHRRPSGVVSSKRRRRVRRLGSQKRSAAHHSNAGGYWGELEGYEQKNKEALQPTVKAGESNADTQDTTGQQDAPEEVFLPLEAEKHLSDDEEEIDLDAAEVPTMEAVYAKLPGLVVVPQLEPAALPPRKPTEPDLNELYNWPNDAQEMARHPQKESAESGGY